MYQICQNKRKKSIKENQDEIAEVDSTNTHKKIKRVCVCVGGLRENLFVCEIRERE